MEGQDIFLECNTCKEKIGVATMASVGTPHQWIAGIVCVRCLRKKVEYSSSKMEEKLGKERFEEIITWLESA